MCAVDNKQFHYWLKQILSASIFMVQACNSPEQFKDTIFSGFHTFCRCTLMISLFDSLHSGHSDQQTTVIHSDVAKRS